MDISTVVRILLLSVRNGYIHRKCSQNLSNQDKGKINKKYLKDSCDCLSPP